MKTAAAVAIVVALFACLVRAGDDVAKPPEGAIVLFSGSDLSAWQHANGKPAQWKIVDGALEASPPGDIQTKQAYDDYALHVEFRTPQPKEGQSGQGRGNSGIKLAGRYEIQILESYGLEPLANGCGSVYRQKAAAKNMAKPPMQWQTYDIVFRAPRFDAAGKKTENGRVTVTWNGEKVHDDVEIKGPTRAGETAEPAGAAPVVLQFHEHPVQFRNIWIVPTKDVVTK